MIRKTSNLDYSNNYTVTGDTQYQKVVFSRKIKEVINQFVKDYPRRHIRTVTELSLFLEDFAREVLEVGK